MNTQMHSPPLTKTNKILIVTSVALFLAHSIFSKAFEISIVSLLGLSAAFVNKGMLFQFITFPFVESSFMTVLFNSLLIWFIGADLEFKWGKKFYLQYFGITTIGAGVFYYLISILFKDSFYYFPFTGLTGFTYAILIAYGLIYSDRQMTFMLLFPMKAKYFCMLLVGIQLYMGLFSASAKIALTHLVSMALGFLYLNYRSLKARGGIKKWRNEQHKRKMRGKLSIVKEDQDKADPKNPRYWQ